MRLRYMHKTEREAAQKLGSIISIDIRDGFLEVAKELAASRNYDPFPMVDGKLDAPLVNLAKQVPIAELRGAYAELVRDVHDHTFAVVNAGSHTFGKYLDVITQAENAARPRGWRRLFKRRNHAFLAALNPDHP